MKEAKPTPGAIRAAEIITGYGYDDKAVRQTGYGPKTTAGIADLIDRETAAPALLRALRAMTEAFTRHPGNGDERHHAATIAYAAIAQATGEEVPT